MLSIFSSDLCSSEESEFTERSLNFLEITSKSPGPLPSLLPPRARGPLLCSPAAGSASPLPPLYRRRSATSCWDHLHASPSSSPGPVPLPWWPPARAPRLPRASAGRHLLVAVDSPPRSLNSRSLARNSITSTPTFCSSSSSTQFRALDPHSTAAVFSCSGHARHSRGQPSPDLLRPNPPLRKLPRSSLVLLDHQLSSDCNRSFASDERRRRRLRSHRGQLTPSSPAPPQPPSQHYIIPVKLHDPSISPLVQHIDFPTLAGFSPRRRRFCLRRSPLIQHVFIQLVARTPSP
jgi:hypothetical protein